MNAFVKEKVVRFKHCDPAGIVFYPSFFEMLNDLVEDWFAEALDFDFARMHDTTHNMGVPMVHVSCDFKKPAYLGELLRQELSVVKMGQSSCEMQAIYRAADAEEELKLQMQFVIVCLDLRSKRPAIWNPALRQKMLAFSL